MALPANESQMCWKGINMSLKSVIKRLLGKEEMLSVEYYRSLGVEIGENFQFNSGYPIDINFPWLISIGDNVTLASDVRLLAHDASTSIIDGVRTKLGIVKIGSNVFIGANSVVTHDVPSNSVYAGNPAKFICTFDEFSEKHRKSFESHPTFHEHPWYEWGNASDEEKQKMKEKLTDTFGYL